MNLTCHPQTGQALRQSNIELLRIIAMIMIVAHHFAVHGGFEFSNEVININRLWIQFIELGGKIGVDIFVLISGYFLISAQGTSINKAIKLWVQIFSYSILIFAIFTFTGMEAFSIKELIKHCFPLIFSQWWFASTYFVLYLVSPYVNRLLKSFEKSQYIQFLLFFGVLWCIIPTFTRQHVQSNNLLWFIYLYSFAGYLRLFGCIDRFKDMTYILFSMVLILLTFASAIVFDILGTKIPFFANYATFFYNMQYIPVFSISALLFIGFSKINIWHNRVINILSSATFGVYLLHENSSMRKFLWKAVFSNASYTESNLLIPYSLLVIAVVFTGCTLVELARIHILEKNYMTAINIISGLIAKMQVAALQHL